MYASILRVRNMNNVLCIVSNYFIAPAGTKVFAVLGEDRILYTPIDSELGKEYAVRIVKGSAWNVEIVKVGRYGTFARYTILKRFAQRLGLSRGDYVLAIGNEPTLEIIPIRVALEKIGRFREPVL